MAGLIVQFLNGLAEASSLFMVAAGLSLIFGVTRIVNFAHGSLYMLGLYLSYTLVQLFGKTVPGFWAGVLAAALLVGVLGAAIETLLLRRVYRSPELFQLLATFALVLIFNDLTLGLWGPEDLFGPRAPGLSGSVQLLGYYLPSYDLFLMIAGPVVLGGLWFLLTRTRWGAYVRAATQDREMLGALGVNQAWLFTAVFAIGAALAGLGGALQLPRTPASLYLDISVVVDAFVVVVVGGMGSITGAYVAALAIAELKALCVALGTISFWGVDFAFPKLTLVIEFLFMAVVLVIRPYGLFGRAQAPDRHAVPADRPLQPASSPVRIALLLALLALLLVPLLRDAWPYLPILVLDGLIAALFALSLHFMMGPGGMISFGHAAFFGLGAYGAALLFKHLGLGTLWALSLGPVAAGVAAVLVGWFCIRLSGVYLAMLTLAFAQIVWSVVYQWDAFTGGSNGLIGLWPPAWLEGMPYYYLVLALVGLAAWLLRRIVFSPFGYALRACRDSPLRAAALGIPTRGVQWTAFILAGTLAGLAGALFAFSKGGVDPNAASIGKSVDALVMVLLGGLQSLNGPLVGAGLFHFLEDTFIGATAYWHAWFGAAILLLVLLAPRGLTGHALFLRRLRLRPGRPPR